MAQMTEMNGKQNFVNKHFETLLNSIPKDPKIAVLVYEVLEKELLQINKEYEAINDEIKQKQRLRLKIESTQNSRHSSEISDLSMA